MATDCINEITVEEIAKHTNEKYGTVHDFKATRISTTNVQGAEILDEVEISIKKPNKFMSEDKKLLRFDSNDTEIMITGAMTKEEFIKIAESMN
ncbi:DUF4367 domain-containing protein [Methanosarcina sp. UBA411]|uniref:DUF4367 domain-containing protein n=1 Tax=Methanosarcina sp. UBA411 TaxID=1915589 RepID=UPI0025F0AF0F|nr:DUF4367 domain-containing protein [Methanosarcina sp. UBA411]